MSTHSSHLNLTTEYRDGSGVGYIGVASDIGVDLCARLTVSEGRSVDDDETYGRAQIHLNPDQAERVANALLAIVADLRRRGADPEWAGRTAKIWEAP